MKRGRRNDVIVLRASQWRLVKTKRHRRDKERPMKWGCSVTGISMKVNKDEETKTRRRENDKMRLFIYRKRKVTHVISLSLTHTHTHTQESHSICSHVTTFPRTGLKNRKTWSGSFKSIQKDPFFQKSLPAPNGRETVVIRKTALILQRPQHNRQ